MKSVFGIVFCLSVLSAVFAATDKVFCYYGSWAIYRSGNGTVTSRDINPNLCTHILYSFAGITSVGNVTLLDTWADLDLAQIPNFNAVKQQNPKLKTLLAIGGWNAGSESFSTVANNVTLRRNFATNAIAFLKQYNFDGLDIDWEYPGLRGGNATTDRTAFVELLKVLRPAFDKNGLLLTAAVAAVKSYHTTSYDVPSLHKYLDFINIMTYDFHGTWDTVTGQNSPLYADKKRETDRSLNVDASVQDWVAAGASPGKLLIGIAAYGRSFTLANARNNTVGAAIVGAGLPGPYTQEAGTLSYLEICEKQKSGNWTEVWDNRQKNPYAFNGNQWVGYDNVKSVTLKAKYAIEKKLAGVMVWSIESDDARNSCGQGSYPLLSAIHKRIPKKKN